MEHWKRKAVTMLDRKLKIDHWMQPSTVNIELEYKNTFLVVSQLVLTDADQRFSSWQTLSFKTSN